MVMEKLLKKHICRDERLGGFTAENYIVHTDDEQKYVVKFLRNAFDNYIDKVILRIESELLSDVDINPKDMTNE